MSPFSDRRPDRGASRRQGGRPASRPGSRPDRPVRRIGDRPFRQTGSPYRPRDVSERSGEPAEGMVRRDTDQPGSARRDGERRSVDRRGPERRGVERRGGERRGVERRSLEPRFRGGSNGEQRRPRFSSERSSFSPPARPSRPSADSSRSPATQPTALQEGDHFAPSAPDDLIWGRHSVQATLESGRPVHRLWCTSEMRFSPRFLQLLREAKASGVLVEEVTWARLGQITGGAVHQGIVLQAAAADTLDLSTLIEGCHGLGEAPLLIAVDGLTDPQNLGAIVRSAEALGAHGMVLPQRRNAGLTGSVAKVAAGALEHLPVARVVNLNRSLDTLKQEGYRVIGLAEQGTVSLEEADLEGPLVLVTGSEGDGLSMLTRRSCDQIVRIPLRGATPSLNASVATALLLYEVARRGWMRGLGGSSPAPRIVRPALSTTPSITADQAPSAPGNERQQDLGPEAAINSEPLEPMGTERLLPTFASSGINGAASEAPPEAPPGAPPAADPEDSAEKLQFEADICL